MGRKKLTNAEKIRRMAGTGVASSDIAAQLNVTKQYVYQVLSNARRHEKKAAAAAPLPQLANEDAEQGWTVVHVSASNTPLPITAEEPKSDPVHHPAHYKVGGVETIDFIEAKGLGYHLGNVVKYVTRADYKGNRKQDLEKARWYLDRAIERA